MAMTMYEVGVATPLRCMKCKNATWIIVMKPLHWEKSVRRNPTATKAL